MFVALYHVWRGQAGVGEASFRRGQGGFPEDSDALRRELEETDAGKTLAKRAFLLCWFGLQNAVACYFLHEGFAAFMNTKNTWSTETDILSFGFNSKPKTTTTKDHQQTTNALAYLPVSLLQLRDGVCSRRKQPSTAIAGGNAR